MSRKRSARRAVLACACFAVLGLVAGASPAAAKTKTKTATFSQCVSGTAPILDKLTNSLSVSVPVPKNGKKVQSGTVTAFQSAAIRITHTYASDLDIVLVSPAGKAVPLVIEQGSNRDGFGTGPADCTGSLVSFSDAFTTPTTDIASGSGPPVIDPVTGQFKPLEPLSGFVGGPARGLWTLVVQDCCEEDTGSIDALSLQFTYTYKAPAKKKKGGK
jgi:subtilisin-like proprotein convertase family protein